MASKLNGSAATLGPGTTIPVLFRLGYVLTFKLCLDIATVLVSAEALGKYSIDLDYSFTTILFGYLAAIFMAVCLPNTIHRIDALLIWILVLFLGIPVLIPYQWSGASFEWFFANTLFLAALGAQQRVAILKVSAFEVYGGWWFLGMFLGAVAAYAVLASILFAGLTFTLDFSLVYGIRDNFKELNIPFAAYAFKWTAFVVVPFLILAGLVFRKYYISVLATVIALVLFFASGHKMYLLIPAFIIGVDVCLRLKHAAFWFVGGITSLVLIGTLAFYTIGDLRLNATFSNRLYVLPAKISYEYHEYFSSNPKVMLSHSVLAGWLEYPYSASPESIISGRYYADPEGSPNTGMIADAFMNFGYTGLVVLWFLVALVLRVIRWIGQTRNQRLVMGLVFIPVFTWVNAGFLTSFLTAGLALALAGAFFLPTVNDRKWQLLVPRERYNELSGSPA